MMFLPLPAEPQGAAPSLLPLPVTLDLVEALEHAGGSIFKIAEQLTARELTFSEVVQLLYAVYAHARALPVEGGGVARTGNEGSAQRLAEYFLAQGGECATLLLTQIVLAILAPAQELGAVVRYGEAASAAGKVQRRRRAK